MKNWSTIEKGDKLYLLVPFGDGQGGIKYVYQESQVINVHKYDWCTNVRFKYTDITGKRRRIELCVNKLKYDKLFVPVSTKTRWARDVPTEYGDIVITFKDEDTLQSAWGSIIRNKIDEVEKNIDEQKKILASLFQMQYERII